MVWDRTPFCLHWDLHRLHGFNGSGRSPAAFDAEGILARGQIEPVGWEPVTTPGAIDAWFTLHERFGKLPMARLLEPAIRMAQDGFRVAPNRVLLGQVGGQVWSSFRLDEHVHPGWSHAKTRRAGSIARTRAHAEDVGEGWPRCVLPRRTGRAFARFQRARRWCLRAEDLATHAGMWVDPISMTCGDVTFHQIPPNGQGIAMLFALGILRELDALALTTRWGRRRPLGDRSHEAWLP